jgi:ABC-type transporter Mla MlaB component
VSHPQPPAGDDRARPRRSVVLVIHGVVTPEAVAGLCARVRSLLGDPGIELVTCDLSGVADPDAAALEALARMQLTARRMGRSIRLAHVRPEMRALLALAGLTDIVPTVRARPEWAGDPPV